MDRREMNHKWYEEFDAEKMTLTVSDGEVTATIKAEYEVCGTCEGQGKHVNPSIDSRGLSREDFDADPDFEREYFSGRYDQPCVECGGKRVVPVASKSASDEDKKLAEDARAEHYQYLAECEAERRMGA